MDKPLVGYKFVHCIPTLEGGGAERQLAILAAEQFSQGANVTICLRRPGLYADKLKAIGITIYELGDNRGLNLVSLIRAYVLLSRIRPTVVQSWLVQMDCLIGILKIFGGSWCWVISERSSAPAYSGRKLQNNLRRYLAFRYADRIVSNSEAGKRYWLQYLSPTRIHVVNNAVAYESIRATNKIPCESMIPTFLVVGRLCQEKNQTFVLSALKDVLKVSQCRFLIFGDGDLKATLVKQVSRDGLAASVEFRPYETAWWANLYTARALVSASRYEGQPNAVIEAVAARCPVILSDIPEHRELLDESSTFFFDLASIRSLAQCLLTALANPAELKRRSDRAYEMLGDRSAKSIAGQYLDVYRAISSKNRDQVKA